MMAFFGVIALGMVMEESWKWRGGGVAVWLVSALCKYALVHRHAGRRGLTGGRSGATCSRSSPRPGGGSCSSSTSSWAGPITRTARSGQRARSSKPRRGTGFESWFDTSASGNGRIIVASYVLYLFILGLMMMYHRLESKTDLAVAVGLAMFLFLYACSPGYHPWYIIWCLPFAALSDRRWLIAGATAFALGAFLPVSRAQLAHHAGQEAGVPSPVDLATAAMWLGTALAAWIGWRGQELAELQFFSIESAPGTALRATPAEARARLSVQALRGAFFSAASARRPTLSGVVHAECRRVRSTPRHPSFAPATTAKPAARVRFRKMTSAVPVASA